MFTGPCSACRSISKITYPLLLKSQVLKVCRRPSIPSFEVATMKKSSIICTSALSLVSIVGCDPTGTESEQHEASESSESSDETSSKDGDSTRDTYVVRGALGKGAGADTRLETRGGFQTHTGTRTTSICPFEDGAWICDDIACLEDLNSQSCQEAVAKYCEEQPQDPGCQGEGPGGEGPGGEEQWICDTDPTFGPCPVCLDPEATQQDCEDAWWEFCEENRTDPECRHEEEPPEAVYTPTSLALMVHKIEFSTDAENCSNPVIVADLDQPRFMDFANGPELVTADAPPAGNYACIIITMTDHIKWNVDGDSPCAGEHIQNIHRDSADDDDETIVQIFMSTAGNSDNDGGDAFSAPGMALDGAHIAGPEVVSSTFVIAFPEGVALRRDENGDPKCEMQEPRFAFLTEYE